MKFWQYINDYKNDEDQENNPQAKKEDSDEGIESNNIDQNSDPYEDNDKKDNTKQEETSDKEKGSPGNDGDNASDNPDQGDALDSTNDTNNSQSASDSRDEQSKENDALDNSDERDNLTTSGSSSDGDNDKSKSSPHSSADIDNSQSTSESNDHQADESNSPDNSKGNENSMTASTFSTSFGNDAKQQDTKKTNFPTKDENSKGEDTDKKDGEQETNPDTSNKENDDTKNEESEAKYFDERKELLQQLKDKIQQYAKKKEELERQELTKSQMSMDLPPIETEKMEDDEVNEENEFNEETNQFLNKLNELPSFKNRETSPGYAIDTNGSTEIPMSVIKTLVTKFLNQRFCKQDTDLNIRSNSFEKTDGFYKWDIKNVIVHLKTHQLTKVLNDKYGYEYANGRNENVPLSFYFDMSGSMAKYTNMLAVLAIELLKKNVKVLIGYNERVNVQIDKIDKNISVAELARIIKAAGNYSSSISKYINKDSGVTYKIIEETLDRYLIDKKAEKCVIFSDFDPLKQVINLSQKTQVYWFCFEDSFTKRDISQFKGFIYKVKDINDLTAGLIKVNERRFEALCYIDNPKELKLGGKK